jgi:thioredoxin-like negative regulator of GroEL
MIALPEIDLSCFAAEVLAAEQPVLLVFRTPWSRPCEVMENILTEVAAACAPHVKVLQIDADRHPDLSLWYEIHSVPTLLCFVTGSVRFRVVGTVTKDVILSKLASIRNGTSEATP